MQCIGNMVPFQACHRCVVSEENGGHIHTVKCRETGVKLLYDIVFVEYYTVLQGLTLKFERHLPENVN